MSVTTQMGEQGFVWFVGIVVDIVDPLKAGRVRVRILNEHFNSTNIENGDLPWAVLMVPTTSASKLGRGISPTGIEVDSYVIGFYMDGMEKTSPVILGSFHLPKRGAVDTGNDVSTLARGEGPIAKNRLDYEPKDPYKAQYPFNKTYTTLSGHAIEIDDTPSAERIHVYHKSGAYVEINPEGSIITKSPKDNIEITVEDKSIFVDNGDLLIDAKNGTIDVKSKENITMDAEKDFDVKAKQFSIDADPVDIKSTSFVVKGNTVQIKAPRVTIDGNVIVNGTLRQRN